MRVPLEFSMTRACCPSMTETHEFVVPKSTLTTGPSTRMSRANLVEMRIRYIPVILECGTRWCTWVVALTSDVGDGLVGAMGDERGWARMGTGDGRGWTRVLELVIIVLSGKKKEKENILDKLGQLVVVC